MARPFFLCLMISATQACKRNCLTRSSPWRRAALSQLCTADKCFSPMSCPRKCLSINGRSNQIRPDDIQLPWCAGTLPDSWHSLQKLQTAALASNGLTGTLPASWGAPGSLPQLTSLDVSSNGLAGDVSCLGTQALSCDDRFAAQEHCALSTLP